MIASLTARANAIKMLHARINLLKSYLISLPPSYLTSSQNTPPTTSTDSTQPEAINHGLLRSISALLSRLPLLVPATSDALASYNSEMLSEKADVELVSLLATMGRSVKDAREMGRKFGIVNEAAVRSKKAGNFGNGPFGGMGLAEPEDDGSGFGGGRAGDLFSGKRPTANGYLS